MKLSNAFKFSILSPLYLSLQLGFLPTLSAILRQPNLLFKLKLKEISQIYMAHVWASYGDGIDQGMGEFKKQLITPNAYGTVLEIGAAFGHTVNHLDRALVTRFIAVEPNKLMHSKIREKAAVAGFHESDSSLLILSCGAEDIPIIQSAIATLPGGTDSSSGKPTVDVILSALTLCSIPNPQDTVTRLAEIILKPGGTFLIFEHVLSHRSDVAWWQHFWAPIWSFFFDGCQLDRPSDAIMRDLKMSNGQSAWKECKEWSPQEEGDEALFWHSFGVFVKQ